MVIGDIIVLSAPCMHSKDYEIKGAQIERKKEIGDFYALEYRFLRRYTGACYQITPKTRNDGNYEAEYMDIAQDETNRILWLSSEVKEKILEMIRDLLSQPRETVIFAAHLQGYRQRKVRLSLKSFEEKMSCGALRFNTAYVISNKMQGRFGFVRGFLKRRTIRWNCLF